MKIQVLGSGCKKCKELYERTKKAVEIIGKEIPVEYITDVQRIVEMGVMSSPVLTIDGKPVLVGELPSVEKIEGLISEYIAKDKNNNDDEGCCGCSCGCDC